MPLAREFKATVSARVAHDLSFRTALLKEAVDLMLEGDITTGKVILRDDINATVGFETLASEVGAPSKSLMRMFGPNGNPSAKNLFSVLSCLQEATRVRLAVNAEA